jgi:hypothetical protein
MADSALTPTRLAQIIQVCEHFEAAWKSGEPPKIEELIDNSYQLILNSRPRRGPRPASDNGYFRALAAPIYC